MRTKEANTAAFSFVLSTSHQKLRSKGGRGEEGRGGEGERSKEGRLWQRRVEEGHHDIKLFCDGLNKKGIRNTGQIFHERDAGD